MGKKTRAAIKEFQQYAGEPTTGEVTDTLVEALKTPCQRGMINMVGYHRGACRKPEEVMPGVVIEELKPGETMHIQF